MTELGLDGLVVVGGDDSNTNACLLAQNFKKHGIATRVIGCPKTIDGDLKNDMVETSFGFDTAIKTQSPPTHTQPHSTHATVRTSEMRLGVVLRWLAWMGSVMPGLAA